MIGVFDIGVRDAVTEAGVSASAADKRPNTDPVTSNTRSVRAQWPGNALSVVWQSSLLKVGQIVQVTPLTSRIRSGHAEVTVEGEVTITRSSGSVADEAFEATIQGRAT